jgi:hypothetical protein
MHPNFIGWKQEEMVACFATSWQREIWEVGWLGSMLCNGIEKIFVQFTKNSERPNPGIADSPERPLDAGINKGCSMAQINKKTGGG